MMIKLTENAEDVRGPKVTVMTRMSSDMPTRLGVGRTRCNESLFLNTNMLPVVDKVEDLEFVVNSSSTFSCHNHRPNFC